MEAQIFAPVAAKMIADRHPLPPLTAGAPRYMRAPNPYVCHFGHAVDCDV